jgi:hypothetical protein
MIKTNKEIKELLGVPDSAFPSYPFSTGLSRREYFAAAALQGLLTYGDKVMAVRDAVKYADQLMEELNRLPKVDNQ